MSTYQIFYIKQFKLELEAVQSIYVQNITNFGHVGWLIIEGVYIFRQDVSGFAST